MRVSAITAATANGTTSSAPTGTEAVSAASRASMLVAKTRRTVVLAGLDCLSGSSVSPGFVSEGCSIHTAGPTRGSRSANAQRHPSVDATTPPYAGPSRPGTAHATANAAYIRGRSRSGYRRVKMASSSAYCAPAPAPSRNRPATNTQDVGAEITTRLPTTNVLKLT